MTRCHSTKYYSHDKINIGLLLARALRSFCKLLISTHNANRQKFTVQVFTY